MVVLNMLHMIPVVWNRIALGAKFILRHMHFGVLPMMLEHYQGEIAERNRRQLEEMNKKAEQSGKGYKGIIDIS